MSTRRPTTTTPTIITSDNIEVFVPDVAAVPTTAAGLQQVQNNILKQKEAKRVSLIEVYKAAEKIGVSGSPMYAPYFGKVMPISLNGILISVPLDGRRYDVPKQFADLFYTRLRSVDSDLAMQKQLSDVTKNQESFAGELDLVRLSQ